MNEEKFLETFCEYLSVTPSFYDGDRFDHLGNEYVSQRVMCDAYGISMGTYQNRRRAGWTLEECLTRKRPPKLFDHEGNGFHSLDEMCEYWGIDKQKYINRKNYGYTMEECLGVIPVINQAIKNVETTADLMILQHVKEDYYQCVLKDREVILHKEDIIQHIRNAK